MRLMAHKCLKSRMGWRGSCLAHSAARVRAAVVFAAGAGFVWAAFVGQKARRDPSVHGLDFATRAEARHCVFDYIEGWYNTTRMHSSLGYKSPSQFEREGNAKSTRAANDDCFF